MADDDKKILRSRSNSFKDNKEISKKAPNTFSLKRTFSFKDPEITPQNEVQNLIDRQKTGEALVSPPGGEESHDDHHPPLFKHSSGFKFESGSGPHDPKKKFLLVEHEKNTAYYQHIFLKKEHINLMGHDEKLGPVIISIENPPNEDSSMLLRALIRHKEDEEWVFIPPGSKNKVKALREAKQELANTKLYQIDDPQLITDLTNLEKKTIVKHYKMGVLVVKEGQTQEEEMFANRDTPPGLDELLLCLGEKIKLQGWTGFRGGLDVKTNTTGEYSYHTKYIDTEIMFHVSTCLPFNPLDYQQLERKRHLGNDVILIIYKEGNTPFDPQIITSEFCHYFAVVSPEPLSPEGVQRYRVGFAAKDGVKTMEPHLPFPPIFEKGIRFREFLLTKLINSERSSMAAPSFIKKMARTRVLVLQGLIDKYTVNLKKGNFGLPFSFRHSLSKEKSDKDLKAFASAPTLSWRKSMESIHSNLKREDSGGKEKEENEKKHPAEAEDVSEASKPPEGGEMRRSNSTVYEKKKPNKNLSARDLKNTLEEREEHIESLVEREKKSSRMIKTSSMKKFFKDGGHFSASNQRKSQSLDRSASLLAMKKFAPKSGDSPVTKPRSGTVFESTEDLHSYYEPERSEDSDEGRSVVKEKVNGTESVGEESEQEELRNEAKLSGKENEI